MDMDSNIWDAQSWKRRFDDISGNMRRQDSAADRKAMRDMRVAVFDNTLSIIRDGGYVAEGLYVAIDADRSARMADNTKFYYREIKPSQLTSRFDTSVSVVNDDCLVEARRLKESGLDVAVLNMASRQRPGGGVLTGAGAQEENIFRRSNLFQSMYQFAQFAPVYGLRRSRFQYPLDRNYGGIYSPDVLIFRGTEADGYPLLPEPYHVAVISVPAINRPELTVDNEIAPSLIPPTKAKMRTILRIAIENGHDALVLGAFGCGAFRNPPRHIARLFHEVLSEEEFRTRFKHISFAIIDDHNSRLSHNPDGNFAPFLSEFGTIETCR